MIHCTLRKQKDEKEYFTQKDENMYNYECENRISFLTATVGGDESQRDERRESPALRTSRAGRQKGGSGVDQQLPELLGLGLERGDLEAQPRVLLLEQCGAHRHLVLLGAPQVARPLRRLVVLAPPLPVRLVLHHHLQFTHKKLPLHHFLGVSSLFQLLRSHIGYFTHTFRAASV